MKQIPKYDVQIHGVMPNDLWEARYADVHADQMRKLFVRAGADDDLRKHVPKMIRDWRKS